MATCTPEALAANSSCLLASMSAAQLDAAETWAACQLASGGGGGGSIQVFNGNYGGASPSQTPTTSAALAYDLDSPFNFWKWNGSAWT